MSFIMAWRDKHVDERGVRHSPNRFLLVALGYSQNAGRLFENGYLIHDNLQPTAKAEAWWIRKKRGEEC